jgi:hypothetical protein
LRQENSGFEVSLGYVRPCESERHRDRNRERGTERKGIGKEGREGGRE